MHESELKAQVKSPVMQAADVVMHAGDHAEIILGIAPARLLQHATDCCSQVTPDSDDGYIPEDLEFESDPSPPPPRAASGGRRGRISMSASPRSASGQRFESNSRSPPSRPVPSRGQGRRCFDNVPASPRSARFENTSLLEGGPALTPTSHFRPIPKRAADSEDAGSPLAKRPRADSLDDDDGHADDDPHGTLIDLIWRTSSLASSTSPVRALA